MLRWLPRLRRQRRRPRRALLQGAPAQGPSTRLTRHARAASARRHSALQRTLQPSWTLARRAWRALRPWQWIPSLRPSALPSWSARRHCAPRLPFPQRERARPPRPPLPRWPPASVAWWTGQLQRSLLALHWRRCACCLLGAPQPWLLQSKQTAQPRRSCGFPTPSAPLPSRACTARKRGGLQLGKCCTAQSVFAVRLRRSLAPWPFPPTTPPWTPWALQPPQPLLLRLRQRPCWWPLPSSLQQLPLPRRRSGA